jgi:PIN domain nuclease of toxin-antitoxin system
VNVLVDPHCLLWWLADQPLSGRATATIRDAQNTVLISPATIWELEIKAALGKLAIDGDLIASVEASGFEWLPITAEHALTAARLPQHHRDPFDRMLIAQALTDGCTLVSRDSAFEQYPVSLIVG